MNGSMGEKIFFTKTPGSHPEEKFGLEAMDPTPKRNLIWKRWIPPQRKIKVGDKGKRTATKVDRDLDLVGLPLRS